jgi:hypothetical protein
MNNVQLLSITLLALVPCLGLAQTQLTPAAGGSTGIEGTISVAPIQGGPSRQGAPDSKPLARMEFEVRQAGRAIQSFQTDDQGRFRVDLQPGQYTIVRKDWKGAVGFYGPFEVNVTHGKMKSVEWQCDAGIR